MRHPVYAKNTAEPTVTPVDKKQINYYALFIKYYGHFNIWFSWNIVFNLTVSTIYKLCYKLNSISCRQLILSFSAFNIHNEMSEFPLNINVWFLFRINTIIFSLEKFWFVRLDEMRLMSTNMCNQMSVPNKQYSQNCLMFPLYRDVATDGIRIKILVNYTHETWENVMQGMVYLEMQLSR